MGCRIAMPMGTPTPMQTTTTAMGSAAAASVGAPHFLDVEAELQCRAQEAARDASITRLLQEQTTQKFGFDPVSLSLLVGLPALLQSLSVPVWAYFPVALLYFSYLSAEKQRNDRKMAIGIVSDPHLVKLGKFLLFSFAYYYEFIRFFNLLFFELIFILVCFK